MARHGEVVINIDRPIEAVFDFLVDGGYTLRELVGATELTFHGDLEGRGFGKLIEAFVSSRVRAGFPAFADAIKQAVEEHT